MIDLAELRACLWDITSAPAHVVAPVREHALQHPAGAARIDTCQRLEVYGLSDCDCPAPTRLHGRDALQHLAEVAAGLHSAVLGDVQVMGQVRAGLAGANATVRRLGAIAIPAARELRREADLDADTGSLLDSALAVAGDVSRGSVLILGTGHQARATARRADGLGFAEITIAGRREPSRTWFNARRFRYRPLADVEALPVPDVLVGCLGEGAGEFEPGRSLPLPRSLVLDLGTPRNFRDVAGVRSLSIKDLLAAGDGHVRTPHEGGRAELRSRLAAILDRRLQMALDDGRSPVGALRASVESARREQLPRLSRLHPDIPPETIDTITRTVVNRIFHRPSERLRRFDDPVLRDRLVELFGDGDGPAPGQEDTR